MGIVSGVHCAGEVNGGWMTAARVSEAGLLDEMWLREVPVKWRAEGGGNGSCKDSEMCGLECLEKERSVWEGMPENVAPGESKQWRGDGVQNTEGWQILWGHQTGAGAWGKVAGDNLIVGCLFPGNSKPAPTHTHTAQSWSLGCLAHCQSSQHRHMCSQDQDTENRHYTPHSLWKSLTYLLYKEPNAPCPCEAFGLADNVWIQIPEINFLFKLSHSWKQLARQLLLRVAIF